MPAPPRRPPPTRRGPGAFGPAEPSVELEIERLDKSGDGIALHDGVTVHVPFTLPGERVRASLPQAGRVARTANVLAVIRPSPHRVAPPCPHFGPCGGCSWQHIAYTEQLRLKTEIVQRLLNASVADAPRVRPTLPGAPADDPWGYRQKVHFVFGNADGARARQPSLVMGHYARGSRRIVAVSECRVHDPRGNAVAFAMRDAFLRAGVAAARSKDTEAAGAQGGFLRSVAVRLGMRSGERMATLVVTSERDKRLRAATRRAIDSEPVTSLHVNVHPRNDGFIFGADTSSIAGPARLREEVAGISFLISPTAFFQTNVKAAELLVRLVVEALGGASDVLDLYAGAGLFALPLAHAGHSVIAVEENREAVADGEASQRLNRIPAAHCRFVARPVEAAIRHIRAASGAVLDPPREGCSPVVLDELLGRIRPSIVVYVSCNPAALARDLNLCASLGYDTDTVQPVDMFPHTAHIETVAVLKRAGPRT